MDSLAIKITKSKLKEPSQNFLVEQEKNPSREGEQVKRSTRRELSPPAPKKEERLTRRQKRARERGEKKLAQYGLTYETFYKQLESNWAGVMKNFKKNKFWNKEHKQFLRALLKYHAVDREIQALNVTLDPGWLADEKGPRKYITKVSKYVDDDWVDSAGPTQPAEINDLEKYIKEWYSAGADRREYWPWEVGFDSTNDGSSDKVRSLYKMKKGIFSKATAIDEAYNEIFAEEIEAGKVAAEKATADKAAAEKASAEKAAADKAAYNKNTIIYKKAWKECHEKDNARACARAGYLLGAGKGVKKDSAGAMKFFKLGCEGGEPWGCRNLAHRYSLGSGVPQNLRKAAKLYKKACNGNDAMACSYLAHIFWDRFKKSRERSDAEAALSLFKKIYKGKAGRGRRAGEAEEAWTSYNELKDEMEQYAKEEVETAKAAELKKQQWIKSIQPAIKQITAMKITEWDKEVIITHLKNQTYTVEEAIAAANEVADEGKEEQKPEAAEEEEGIKFGPEGREQRYQQTLRNVRWLQCMKISSTNARNNCLKKLKESKKPVQEQFSSFPEQQEFHENWKKHLDED